MEILQPPGWPRPKGYSNGIVARGRTIFLGGQVGWNESETFETSDFAGQFKQILNNIVTILKEADAGPEHIVRMTWFIGDKQEYQSALKDIGAAYRDVIGHHYPAMSVIEVNGFIEDRAKLEIEATAVIPDPD
jgi:enamine deaminase RidA (YjgF/YER057c/UK114 family)